MSKLIDELGSAFIEFTYPLRMKEGFDEQKYENFCNVLKKCSKEWAELDSFPRLAVCILVEIVPAIERYKCFYDGADLDKLTKAVQNIHMLILDIVNVDLEDDD